MATGRWFREGFLDSEAVNALSDWTHRVYSNLLIRSDYAGRFDGRLEILRTQLFPLGTNRRVEDFQRAVKEMAATRLVICYEFAGKPFLQITKVEKYGNATTSLYPWRDGSFLITFEKRSARDPQEGEKEFVATSLLDPIAMGPAPPNDGIPPPLLVSESESENGFNGKGEIAHIPIPKALDSPEFREAWAEWCAHRKEIKKRLTPRAVKQEFQDMEKMGLTRAVAAIKHSIAGSYQGIYEKRGSRANDRNNHRAGEIPEATRPLPRLTSKG